jgi:hypothetical protein
MNTSRAIKKEEVKISNTEYAIFLQYQVEQTREVNVSGSISENSVLKTYHRPGRSKLQTPTLPRIRNTSDHSNFFNP